jgi:hypothetical protein
MLQFTLDRAEKFQRLAASWEGMRRCAILQRKLCSSFLTGPIVATLVLNFGETLDHLSEFWSSAYWPIFFFTDIHIVWGNEKVPPSLFPVLSRNLTCSATGKLPSKFGKKCWYANDKRFFGSRSSHWCLLSNRGGENQSRFPS